MKILDEKKRNWKINTSAAERMNVCVHADLRAREKCADNRNRRNEHGKSVFRAKHGHGKSVLIKLCPNTDVHGHGKSVLNIIANVQ